jgi:hypothetical protein
MGWYKFRVVGNFKTSVHRLYVSRVGRPQALVGMIGRITCPEGWLNKDLVFLKPVRNLAIYDKEVQMMILDKR